MKSTPEITQRLTEIAEEFGVAMREASLRLGDGPDRWIMSMHPSENLYLYERQQPRVVCRGCAKRGVPAERWPDWPCADYLNAQRRIDLRHAERERAGQAANRLP